MRFVFFLIIVSVGVAKAQLTKKLLFVNKSFLDKNPENISIKKDSLFKLIGTFTNALPVLTDELGNLIPAQFDDIDGDGNWDELAFQLKYKAYESKLVQFKLVPTEQYPVFQKKTFSRLGVDYSRAKKYVGVKSEEVPANHVPMVYPCIYQSEGPVWENEKVAFRSYLDSRNGKDIFGKLKDIWISDSVGVHSDYHNLQNWGLDLLKVGKSLGAGSIALYENGKLYRIGASKSKKYQHLYDGPVRSCFKITHVGASVNGKLYNVTEKISIWAGTYFYSNEVSVEGISNDVKLAVGIANIKSDKKVYETGHNYMYKSLATHCVQSDNYGVDGKSKTGDILGMAIMLPDAGKKFSGFDTSPNLGSDDDVINTEYFKIRIKDKVPVVYEFYAGWELSNPIFKTKEGFLKFLQEEADRKYAGYQIIKL